MPRKAEEFFLFLIFSKILQGRSTSSIMSISLYAKYIMRNAGLEETQAGIKIVRRIINNLRYADDTTLWQKVKRS